MRRGPGPAASRGSPGSSFPCQPRRGFVLVTQPLPRTVHHKVYAGEYIANVLSSEERLQTAPVVEGTPGGTVLIGSSRERVGFDRTVSLRVLTLLARQAVGIVPVLRGAQVIRSYLGFRPYCPDHLPVIGEDRRVPGLWHAGGHEGAGIGLSVGTAKLLAQALMGTPTDLDLAPFAPDDSRATSSRHPVAEPITLAFDGRPIHAYAGDSVGAALVRAGVRSWRTTRRKGRPRGLLCGIGVCYDCLLTVDGAPDQRACLVPAVDGMDVRSAGDQAGGR